LSCVLLEMVLMAFFRYSYRGFLAASARFRRWSRHPAHSKVLVVAGPLDGKALIEKIRADNREKTVVAVVDPDESHESGYYISGVRVYGCGLKSVESSIRLMQADEVVASRNGLLESKLLDIVRICSENRCRLLVDSGIQKYDGIRNRVEKIQTGDLLGRVQTEFTLPARRVIKNKTVLVTGGAGSIGSEICRQSLEYGCAKLVIFDIHENGLFEIDADLKKTYPRQKYQIVVGSVRDAGSLDRLFAEYRPDVIFHAAAHKHVPLMESNPAEAVKNNVFGTFNVARFAIRYRAEKFILISTDKAVKPTNVMGATKRVAEMIVEHLNVGSKFTRLAAVRFGNVLGSNGSVVPLFKRQIMHGGPVTVTHPDIRRFFMTIPEAVQLVMQAGELTRGGEIFVLDMGEPVKIADLAAEMIRMSGFEPQKDIKIEFTGLRPGEKMYEELSLDDEDVQKTVYDRIFVCKSSRLARNLEEDLKTLKMVADNGEDAGCKAALKEIVAEYNS
ncbi:MAG TPA: nucleoside-diphosphate sugar epimerase/dehydratase, partial [Clostridia bacterium]|nr:nucleoside-diphosphate sugar epimerase/dehydratase [Clostridia bacterium]